MCFESKPDENVDTDKKYLLKRRFYLKQWLNKHTQGEDSFTALHFASFHGNLTLIRLFI